MIRSGAAGERVEVRSGHRDRHAAPVAIRVCTIPAPMRRTWTGPAEVRLLERSLSKLDYVFNTRRQ